MNNDTTLMELQRGLGRVEGKLDQLIDMHTAQATDIDVITKRVDKLEGWRSYVNGAAVVITGLVVAAFKLVVGRH